MKGLPHQSPAVPAPVLHMDRLPVEHVEEEKFHIHKEAWCAQHIFLHVYTFMG